MFSLTTPSMAGRFNTKWPILSSKIIDKYVLGIKQNTIKEKKRTNAKTEQKTKMYCGTYWPKPETWVTSLICHGKFIALKFSHKINRIRDNMMRLMNIKIPFFILDDKFLYLIHHLLIRLAKEKRNNCHYNNCPNNRWNYCYSS